MLVHVSTYQARFLSHLERDPGKGMTHQRGNLRSEITPGIHMVIVRGLKTNLPPVIGDIEPIRSSKDSEAGFGLGMC